MANPENDVVHLTITEGYAPSWKTWEGVREFIQNWYDGVLDSYEIVSPPSFGRRALRIEPSGSDNELFEAKLIHGKERIPLGTLAYEKDLKRLTMINHNTELQKKVLLLGYSRKRGHHDIIGQFGEGLKIGTLALLRASHKVLVATKNSIWNFSIKAHPTLGEDVLTVTIEANKDPFPADSKSSIQFDEGDTVSQIWPIEEDDWKEWVKRFLFLVPAKEYAETEIGSLLFDEHLLSQLYVKQIWVQDRTDNEDLQVGVNFKDLQIDRDRRAILYQSEIDHSVAIMWSRALKLKPELAGRYYQLLEKSEHSADVRLANMYLEDKGVVRLLADEFLKLYGSNAIPVPNSSAAENLTRLHKELQEKVILCNQNLVDILKKSGKVRMAEDVLNQQRPESSVGRKLFKDIPQEQLVVLTEAEQFVKMVSPDFSTNNIEFHDGRDAVVTCVGINQFEVPQWMLSPEYVHQQIACPAETPDTCICASAYLCERILSSLGPRKNDAGDRKIQEFVLTLALQAKGKRPKRRPALSSVDEVFKRNEEELHKKLGILSECLKDEQKKHEASLEEMRQKLAKFQSELAGEDVRFYDRQKELLERQKQERENMKHAVEEQLRAHEKEIEEGKEDYFRISSDLEAEKKKKRDLEFMIESEKDKHKNELTLKNQETIVHRKRLATNLDNLSQIQMLGTKKANLSRDTRLYKQLQEWKNQKEQEQRGSGMCLICTTANKDCALKPCGHQFCVLCCDGGLKLCPVCFKDVKDKKML